MNLVARARELRPLLLEQRAGAQHLLPEGFHRMLVPTRYGGLEVDVPTFLFVLLEIARGSPPAASRLAQYTASALPIAALFEEAAQAEIFGGDELRCPTLTAPAVLARRVDDGWELRGSHGDCAGASEATHILGQALAYEHGADGAPTPLVFVAPREQWVLDDGDGNSVPRFDGVVIADRRVLRGVSVLEPDVTDGTPGYRLHGNPLYAGRALSFYQAAAAAVQTGAAMAAVDEYERLVRTEATPLPPVGPRRLDPDYQRWLGAAIGRVTAAELLLAETGGQYMEACAGIEAGEPFSREADMRLTAMGREAMKLAWSAVHDIVIRTAGSDAMRPGEPIERIARDLLAGERQSVTLMEDTIARQLARERLGLPVA
jgi:3-hydroxy-9,10-secoandrosta-1,3,5(10)-triene-9,17-dione monooxygenase